MGKNGIVHTVFKKEWYTRKDRLFKKVDCDDF